MKRLRFIRKIAVEQWPAIVIILCAAFLRLWRLPDFATFLADQGRDAIIIKRIVTFEHFPAIGPPSSIGQVYLGPFFYYLIAPFLIPFRFDPVGLAFGVSLLSIVGITLSYFIVHKHVGKLTALIFLIFASFSSHLIDFNRFSWNPNLLPYFSFFTLFFLYKTVYSHRSIYPLLFGSFFAFSFQLHHLAAFMAFPIAAVFLYVLAWKKNKLMRLKSIFLSLMAFAVISLPLIVFDLKHDFLNMKNLYSLFTKQNLVAGGSPTQRLMEANQAFWNIVCKIQMPPLAALLISLALIGALLFLHFTKRLHPFILINALNGFSFIYLFSLLSSPRFPHYYGPAYLSLFLVIAYVLSVKIKPPWIGALSIVIITLFVWFNANHYYFIFGASNNQIQYSKNVADWIAPHIRGNRYNFATYPIEFTSEDAFTYFLEIKGFYAADRSKHEVTNQMFVVCNIYPCDVLHTGSWNINMFGRAKIDTMWRIKDLTIFQLSHAK